MHIITKTPINEFVKKYPETQSALEKWYKIVETSNFLNFGELKKTFPSVDKYDKFTIFNVGGNKVRLVVAIHYNTGKIYIRHVLTHSEYDTDKWKNDIKN